MAYVTGDSDATGLSYPTGFKACRVSEQKREYEVLGLAVTGVLEVVQYCGCGSRARLFKSVS